MMPIRSAGPHSDGRYDHGVLSDQGALRNGEGLLHFKVWPAAAAIMVTPGPLSGWASPSLWFDLEVAES